ncbi:hypothetical protein EDC96DRAFT_339849 [Choanephora cucurbitarum]|nr:hypothetical protein EDC96DRAFT_339849 [Choanephora cucurbitarum]
MKNHDHYSLFFVGFVIVCLRELLASSLFSHTMYTTQDDRCKALIGQSFWVRFYFNSNHMHSIKISFSFFFIQISKSLWQHISFNNYYNLTIYPFGYTRLHIVSLSLGQNRMLSSSSTRLLTLVFLAKNLTRVENKD